MPTPSLEEKKQKILAKVCSVWSKLPGHTLSDSSFDSSYSIELYGSKIPFGLIKSRYFVADPVGKLNFLLASKADQEDAYINELYDLIFSHTVTPKFIFYLLRLEKKPPLKVSQQFLIACFHSISQFPEKQVNTLKANDFAVLGELDLDALYRAFCGERLPSARVFQIQFLHLVSQFHFDVLSSNVRLPDFFTEAGIVDRTCNAKDFKVICQQVLHKFHESADTQRKIQGLTQDAQRILSNTALDERKTELAERLSIANHAIVNSRTNVYEVSGINAFVEGIQASFAQKIAAIEACFTKKNASLAELLKDKKSAADLLATLKEQIGSVAQLSTHLQAHLKSIEAFFNTIKTAFNIETKTENYDDFLEELKDRDNFSLLHGYLKNIHENYVAISRAAFLPRLKAIEQDFSVAIDTLQSRLPEFDRLILAEAAKKNESEVAAQPATSLQRIVAALKRDTRRVTTVVPDTDQKHTQAAATAAAAATAVTARSKQRQKRVAWQPAATGDASPKPTSPASDIPIAAEQKLRRELFDAALQGSIFELGLLKDRIKAVCELKCDSDEAHEKLLRHIELFQTESESAKTQCKKLLEDEFCKKNTRFVSSCEAAIRLQLDPLKIEIDAAIAEIRLKIQAFRALKYFEKKDETAEQDAAHETPPLAPQPTSKMTMEGRIKEMFFDNGLSGQCIYNARTAQLTISQLSASCPSDLIDRLIRLARTTRTTFVFREIQFLLKDGCSKEYAVLLRESCRFESCSFVVDGNIIPQADFLSAAAAAAAPNPVDGLQETPRLDSALTAATTPRSSDGSSQAASASRTVKKIRRIFPKDERSRQAEERAAAPPPVEAGQAAAAGLVSSSPVTNLPAGAVSARFEAVRECNTLIVLVEHAASQPSADAAQAAASSAARPRSRRRQPPTPPSPDDDKGRVVPATGSSAVTQAGVRTAEVPAAASVTVKGFKDSVVECKRIKQTEIKGVCFSEKSDARDLDLRGITFKDCEFKGLLVNAKTKLPKNVDIKTFGKLTRSFGKNSVTVVLASDPAHAPVVATADALEINATNATQIWDDISAQFKAAKSKDWFRGARDFFSGGHIVDRLTKMKKLSDIEKINLFLAHADKYEGGRGRTAILAVLEREVSSGGKAVAPVVAPPAAATAADTSEVVEKKLALSVTEARKREAVEFLQTAFSSFVSGEFGTLLTKEKGAVLPALSKEFAEHLKFAAQNSVLVESDILEKCGDDRDKSNPFVILKACFPNDAFSNIFFGKDDDSGNAQEARKKECMAVVVSYLILKEIGKNEPETRQYINELDRKIRTELYPTYLYWAVTKEQRNKKDPYHLRYNLCEALFQLVGLEKATDLAGSSNVRHDAPVAAAAAASASPRLFRLPSKQQSTFYVDCAQAFMQMPLADLSGAVFYIPSADGSRETVKLVSRELADAVEKKMESHPCLSDVERLQLEKQYYIEELIAKRSDSSLYERLRIVTVAFTKAWPGVLERAFLSPVFSGYSILALQKVLKDVANINIDNYRDVSRIVSSAGSSGEKQRLMYAVHLYVSGKIAESEALRNMIVSFAGKDEVAELTAFFEEHRKNAIEKLLTDVENEAAGFCKGDKQPPFERPAYARLVAFNNAHSSSRGEEESTAAAAAAALAAAEDPLLADCQKLEKSAASEAVQATQCIIQCMKKVLMGEKIDTAELQSFIKKPIFTNKEIGERIAKLMDDPLYKNVIDDPDPVRFAVIGKLQNALLSGVVFSEKDHLDLVSRIYGTKRLLEKLRTLFIEPNWKYKKIVFAFSDIGIASVSKGSGFSDRDSKDKVKFGVAENIVQILNSQFCMAVTCPDTAFNAMNNIMQALLNARDQITRGERGKEFDTNILRALEGVGQVMRTWHTAVSTIVELPPLDSPVRVLNDSLRGSSGSDGVSGEDKKDTGSSHSSASTPLQTPAATPSRP